MSTECAQPTEHISPFPPAVLSNLDLQALFKSEAGIAEQMVAAGGGKDQSDDLGVSYLRDAFKFAMSHAQSETLANFRYKAALSGVNSIKRGLEGSDRARQRAKRQAESERFCGEPARERASKKVFRTK